MEDYKHPRERPRLEFIEGLRALAALFVVMSHAATVAPRSGLSLPFRAIVPLFFYGHYAVSIFIVVSGYCLMLPVAASQTHELRGGLREFIYRRSKRILPPYYAALFLSVSVSLVARHMAPANEKFSIGSFLSHLILMHNVRPDWAVDYNGVLWTLATEWQIYFAFALLLLPIYRFAGIATVVVVAAILGITPCLMGFAGDLVGACYWYIALFAFGMAGAHYRFQPRARAWIARHVTTSLIVTATLLAIAMAYVPYSRTWQEMLYLDILFGAATAILILYCTAEGDSAITRLLACQPLRKLGLFSYSLYLVHMPIISTIDWCIKRMHPSDNLLFVCQFAVVIPATIALSYLFFIIFERPFLTDGSKLRVRA